jgi:hypothetical protein
VSSVDALEPKIAIKSAIKAAKVAKRSWRAALEAGFPFFEASASASYLHRLLLGQQLHEDSVVHRFD